MELNQKNTDNSQYIVNKNQKVFHSESINYLYPNDHCITHQIRWFKGCRDRGLKSDIAL